jgi:2-polyprenyl-3-methyl-5-hydroxy-6-metoxy-1,4-benzoquinol methylase
MDDLTCSGETVDQTLRELELINRKLGGTKATLAGLHQLLMTKTLRGVVTIADLGCGGGDILRQVADWGTLHKISLQLTGFDANPAIVAFAEKNSAGYPAIQYENINIFSTEFKKKKFDVILATLFTHHFSNDQLVYLLNSLKNQAQIGIIVNDIHRHWLAYYSIRLLTHFLSKSEMVKFDAPLSVLRAFTRAELEELLQQAGIRRYTLHWSWAFRWKLVIYCSPAA